MKKLNFIEKTIIVLTTLIIVYYLLKYLQINFLNFISQYFGLISIVLIGLSIYLFYEARKQTESKASSEFYSHIATLLQTIFAIFAIWYAIQENKANNEQFKEQISNQKRQIEQQETQIGKQDKQISQQDQQLKTQAEISNLTLNELKSISGSSSSLKSNIERINNMIATMPNKIDEVARSFEELNDYTAQQVSIQQSEYQREANIEAVDLICEDEYNSRKYHIKGIKLFNSGNIDGSVYKIILQIPAKMIAYKTIYTGEGNPITDLDTNSEYINIVLSYNNLIVAQQFPQNANCHYQFYYVDPKIEFRYILESYSKYKGFKETHGVIEPTNCKKFFF